MDLKTQLLEKATEQLSKINTISGQLTGVLSAHAKYNNEIPTPVRVRMLDMLIQIWEENDPNSCVTEKWVREWKAEKEILLAPKAF